ncbi:HAD family hydrolase [Mucilaginibacter hurinus]|uniref:D,D-heptose 1,7-bisphosphate phosphatase n=1 Tax=Mucilaginibacter hurinus TaxID=2201324 RepID=A0A367GPB1_9SPHI|nr:HAD family hydrolase [Mucilaginibacter hurinus]RCH55317.1 HAD family hydrolase [Mucilaginibacter hurinus]
MYSKKAVFLDKDGTLIPDIPYNVNPELITIQPDAIDGLRRLQTQGYILVIVSNQSGVARGYFTEDKLIGVEHRLKQLLANLGLHLSGFYYCPHHDDGIITQYALACECRKPQAGMLLQAAADLQINMADSWMIGDILNDVEAGHRAGCKTVLINNGNETEWVPGEFRTPTLICGSINEAALSILNTTQHEQVE